MGGILRYTLAVRHPDSGLATAILKGTEPPAWAEGQYDPADLEDDGPIVVDTVEDDTHGPADGDGGGKPAGNATEDAWRAYALANGKSEDDLKGLGRNEIRDLFA